MTNVPTAGPPSVRAMAYVSTTGEFTSLTPTGPAAIVADNIHATVGVDDTSSPGEIIYSATLMNPLAGHTYSYSWAPEDDAGSMGSYSGETTDTLTYTKPVPVTGCQRLITFQVTVTDDASGETVAVNRGAKMLLGNGCDAYATVGVDDTSSPGEIIYSATLVNSLAGHSYSYSWAPEDDAGSMGSYSGETTDTLTYTKPVPVTGCQRLIAFKVTVTDDTSGEMVAVNRGAKTLLGNGCDAYATVDVDATSSPGEIIYSASLVNQLPGHAYSYSWTPENFAGSLGSYSGETTDTLTYTEPDSFSGCCALITFRVTVTDETTGAVVAVNRGSAVLSGDSCQIVWTPVPDLWREIEFFEIPLCPKFCPPPDPPWPEPRPWPPRGPWPGPGPEPCWQCPPEWLEPLREGFDQTTLVFKPFDEAGKEIGPGMAEQMTVEILDGRAIGALYDRGNGEYIQVVEHQVGEAASVTVRMGEIATAEFKVGRRMTEQEVLYRNLFYGVGGLLLASLAGIGVLVRRGRQRPQQTTGAS